MLLSLDFPIVQEEGKLCESCRKAPKEGPSKKIIFWSLENYQKFRKSKTHGKRASGQTLGKPSPLCDAGDYAIGVVLGQRVDNKLNFGKTRSMPLPKLHIQILRLKLAYFGLYH